MPELFVIARTSTFTYKGRAEKAQTIGRELGVKYLLEGSARRAGEDQRSVRSMPPPAAKFGRSVYDRQMRDIFKLQDEIVQSLTTTLGLQLSMLERGFRGFVFAQRTNNLEAYDHFLRGMEGWFVQTSDAFDSSLKMFGKAVALDPAYADAYAWLAWTDLCEYLWQLTSDSNVLDRDERLAQKAVLLDDSNSAAYAILGWVAFYRNRPDEAIADEKRALALDANNSLACAALSEVLNYLRRPGEALVYSQKAMRLDPKGQENFALQSGNSYIQMGRYLEAIEVLKAGAANNPWVHVQIDLCLYRARP